MKLGWEIKGKTVPKLDSDVPEHLIKALMVDDTGYVHRELHGNCACRALYGYLAWLEYYTHKDDELIEWMSNLHQELTDHKNHILELLEETHSKDIKIFIDDD